MKIILLMLGIIILIFKKTSIKALFKSKEKCRQDVVNSFTKAKETCGDYYNSLAIIIGLFVTIPYLLFYLLSAIYINNFIFTIISIVMLIATFKSFWKYCVQISDINNKYKYTPKIFTALNILIVLFYIGFVFYQIYLKW